MCRNITELRGLEPAATREEIEAAARQYIRKVTGVPKPNAKVAGALDALALEVADVTERALALVPDRRQPPDCEHRPTPCKGDSTYGALPRRHVPIIIYGF